MVLTIDLTDDDVARLRAIAEREGRSLEAVAHDALLDYAEADEDEDGFDLTSDELAELERRDAELAGGAVQPLDVAEMMQRVRGRIAAHRS